MSAQRRQAASDSQIDNATQARRLESYLSLPDDREVALEWVIHSRADSQFDARSGRIFANDEASAITDLVHHYADLLGERYAIVPSGEASETPLITVSNVRSLIDISVLTEYLEELTPVQAVSLVAVEGNVATFSVSLIGTLNDLNASLTFDERLTSVSNDADFQSAVFHNDVIQLHYFWKG